MASSISKNCGPRIPCGDPGTPTRLLLDDDPAAHRGTVHGAIVLIGPRRRERECVRHAIAGLDGAAREIGRPLRLDAVRDRSRGGPGPRDGAADRDCVDRGVLSPVVSAPEQDVPDGDLTDRATAAPSAAAPTPPAGTPPGRGTATHHPRHPPPTDYCFFAT